MKKIFSKEVPIYIVFTGIILSLTACSSFSKLDTLGSFQGELGKEYVVFESYEKVHKIEVVKKDKNNNVYSIFYEDENGDYKIDRILIYKGIIWDEFHFVDPNTGTITNNEFKTNLVYVNRFDYYSCIFDKIKFQRKFNHYLRAIQKSRPNKDSIINQ